MMQSCASAAKLRGGGPILHSGLEAMGLRPSDRHRQTLQGRQVGVPFSPSVLMTRKTTPCGTSPVVTRRHRAMSSLRASATIIVLRVLRASVGGSRLKPLGQGAVLLEPEKTPSELDHAAPDAGIAGARKSLLASTSAALVRRAGEAGVAGDGLAITQVAREDLVDQHVRGLDADAEDPCNQTNHRVRALLRQQGPPQACAGVPAR